MNLTSELQHQVIIEAVDEFLEIRKCKFNVVVLNVDDITDFVTNREQVWGFFELEKEILTNGMKNPIIVTENTREAYDHGKQTVVSEYLADFNPDKQYLCLFGNQRLAIANRNGFTSISGVIVKTPFEAIIFNRYLNPNAS